MKNLMILCLLFIFFSNTSPAQQYYMNGRFVNTAPDSISLDSVAFVFTPTTYAYYINAATTPSSSGTYVVVTTTTSPDSLILFEDSLGVCNTNGGGNTIRFQLQYQLNPYYGLNIIETAHSIDSCPSHSYKIQGDYIGYTGQIIFTNSVNSAASASGLDAHIYEGKLAVKSQYNETISVQVMNLNGQRALKVQRVPVLKGQVTTFDLADLPPGMYFVVVQSEHVRKTLKIVL